MLLSPLNDEEMEGQGDVVKVTQILGDKPDSSPVTVTPESNY